MIVLLHLKVLQIQQQNNTNSIKLMSQAVSQLEFGRVWVSMEQLRMKSLDLLQSPQSPTATDEEEPCASDNEEDLSIVLIDDEGEED